MYRPSMVITFIVLPFAGCVNRAYENLFLRDGPSPDDGRIVPGFRSGNGFAVPYPARSIYRECRILPDFAMHKCCGAAGAFPHPSWRGLQSGDELNRQLEEQITIANFVVCFGKLPCTKFPDCD